MINSKHGKLRNRTRSLYYLMNYLAEFVELIQPQPFTRCFNKNRDRVFNEKREKKGRKKREGGEGFEERGKKRICAVRAIIFTCWQRGTKGACSDTSLDVEQYISIERPIA